MAVDGVKKVLLVAGIAALVILALWAIGWVGVWCLNTLFGLGLAYTWRTVVAVLVLAMLLNPTRSAE